MWAHCFSYYQSFSFLPSFPFGRSAIWFKWAPLQLASLQLGCFMNCCMVHLRRFHYHLLAFCLPEFSFLCLLLANEFFLPGELYHLTAPLWNPNIFLTFNLLFLMYDRCVFQRITVKHIHLPSSYFCEMVWAILIWFDKAFPRLC